MGRGGRHFVEWQGRPWDKVTLEPRPALKGMSTMAVGGEGSPPARSSEYKSLEVGVGSQLTVQQQLPLATRNVCPVLTYMSGGRQASLHRCIREAGLLLYLFHR